MILTKLRALLRDGDQLLFSVNLAPGRDYWAGVERVLPQYDNAETCNWLLSFLTGIGVSDTAGELVFGIEPVDELLRIIADFKFTQPQAIELEGERVAFDAGQRLRLFFSYRHTAETLAKRLAKHGLQVVFSEIAESGEEGAFRVALSD